MRLFKFLISHFLLPLSFVIIVTPVFSADDGIKTLTKALSTKMPDIKVTKISESPIPGLYEVIVGAQVVYMNKTARYMLDGDLVDLSSRENYTEKAKSGIRLAIINELGEDNMLIYTPKKVDHTITVVTDIDCPYCRRLHSEMGQYMKNNVKVRYIFMPLKGQGDFDTTVSVWCAKDKNKALDMAKSGEKIAPLKCDNPIKQHLALARKMGINGTPAIILQDGQLLPGYVPVVKLIPELNKK